MKILNVGSGSKPLMSKSGHIVHNFDLPSDDAGKHHRGEQSHVDIFGNAIDMRMIRPNVYDLVTFVHSLEHMPYPSLALLEARRVLKDDGHIFIEIPDAKKVGKERREHLYSWSNWSINNLCRECGYNRLKEAHMEKMLAKADLWYKHKPNIHMYSLKHPNLRYYGERREGWVFNELWRIPY